MIKEPRAWKTWQLFVAILASGFVCMLIGNLTAGGSASSLSASATGSRYQLPPPKGASGASGGTTTTVAPSQAAAGGAAAATTTTTTVVPAGGATTSTIVAGTVTVILGPFQSHGNWTSPSFTIGSGTWNIGWAFQCTPPPAAGPSFQVFVVSTGGSPSGAPVVSGTGGSGQSVTSQTSAGSEQLVVEAGASCVWAVKVTGVA
jgi:hypothetical protein